MEAESSLKWSIYLSELGNSWLVEKKSFCVQEVSISLDDFPNVLSVLWYSRSNWREPTLWLQIWDLSLGGPMGSKLHQFIFTLVTQSEFNYSVMESLVFMILQMLEMFLPLNFHVSFYSLIFPLPTYFSKHSSPNIRILPYLTHSSSELLLCFRPVIIQFLL